MGWFVGIVGINQEMLALRGLQSKGFEVYCPIGKRVVRHARKQITKQFPVFSRYIFIKFDINNPEYSEPIRSTDGVIDILANNWKPMEVAPWIIDDIKQREQLGQFDIVPTPKAKIKKRYRGFEILKSLLNPENAVQV